VEEGFAGGGFRSGVGRRWFGSDREFEGGGAGFLSRSYLRGSSSLVK
jgi:hypothetical protein